jgi:hypothetical protein
VLTFGGAQRRRRSARSDGPPGAASLDRTGPRPHKLGGLQRTHPTTDSAVDATGSVYAWTSAGIGKALSSTTTATTPVQLLLLNEIFALPPLMTNYFGPQQRLFIGAYIVTIVTVGVIVLILALAFAGGLAGADSLTSSNPFFRSAAAIIIARLLHAAALSGSTMADVVSWALDLERSTTARDILTDHPDAEMFWAQTLRTASEGSQAAGWVLMA